MFIIYNQSFSQPKSIMFFLGNSFVTRVMVSSILLWGLIFHQMIYFLKGTCSNYRCNYHMRTSRITGHPQKFMREQTGIESYLFLRAVGPIEKFDFVV